ncbi:MAG: hypothetical protein LAO51_08680 [Acidobacteriia bacterium]|nr:hypothetical protein [Terriglobia bacterium]
MKLVALVGVVVLVANLGAWASEPGQPLDCSDWVFFEPGFSCAEVDTSNTDTGSLFERGTNVAIDNASQFLSVWGGGQPEWDIPSFYNGSSGVSVSVKAFDGTPSRTLAQINDRSGVGGFLDHIRPARPSSPMYFSDIRYWTSGWTVVFDAVNGRLIFPVTLYCGNGGCPNYPGQARLVAISGFATLYEIRQTYSPASSTISFRTPAIPEGMPVADYFDTYWGDLATVGTWSQAHGLQCHYPLAPPSRGAYLAVADTLPTPQPGHGYYYVTAATYQGQTRYGRKTSGGKLSGRDPAVLPGCSNP